MVFIFIVAKLKFHGTDAKYVCFSPTFFFFLFFPQKRVRILFNFFSFYFFCLVSLTRLFPLNSIQVFRSRLRSQFGPKQLANKFVAFFLLIAARIDADSEIATCNGNDKLNIASLEATRLSFPFFPFFSSLLFFSFFPLRPWKRLDNIYIYICIVWQQLERNITIFTTVVVKR